MVLSLLSSLSVLRSNGSVYSSFFESLHVCLTCSRLMLFLSLISRQHWIKRSIIYILSLTDYFRIYGSLGCHCFYTVPFFILSPSPNIVFTTRLGTAFLRTWGTKKERSVNWRRNRRNMGMGLIYWASGRRSLYLSLFWALYIYKPDV